MKILKKSILLLLCLMISTAEFHAQTKLKGFVTNETGEALSGTVITDLNDGKLFYCDESGYFDITFPARSTEIEFSTIPYLSVRLNLDTVDFIPIKIVMVKDPRHEDVIMIAPPPPFVEVGYLGRFNNSPSGVHAAIGGRGDKHQLNLDFATKDFQSNNYLNFSYSPGIIDFERNRNLNELINPYLTGTYSSLDSLENARVLLCNSTWIRDFISINYGVGLTRRNDMQAIYNIGLRTNFNFPSVNPYVPLFYQSYFEFDFYMNDEIHDWAGKLYFEFYNKSYRRLSFAVGYESIYGYQDFVFNINFKNYIFKRTE